MKSNTLKTKPTNKFGEVGKRSLKQIYKEIEYLRLKDKLISNKVAARG